MTIAFALVELFGRLLAKYWWVALLILIIVWFLIGRKKK